VTTATTTEDLGAFLAANAPADTARVLAALAAASIRLVDRIRHGSLAGALDADVGPGHDGVPQKALDVFADQTFIDGLRGAGVRGIVSEERDDPLALDEAGTLLVAIDPLDGSSNIDANVTIGTVFSVLDAPPGPVTEAAFLQAGARQRAAGIFVYGPHVSFAFTVGRGTAIAILDPDTATYRVTARAAIPEQSSEFAINVSNARRWSAPVRAYIEDLIEGDEGPRRQNFNMRWVGSMVADVYRILGRGGVYLYPEDSREGYEHGRLRLLYEASPVAFLIEQAGGAATDGFRRILEIEPKAAHERTPLIFGSKTKVERIVRYYGEGVMEIEAPLFATRGLLRR